MAKILGIEVGDSLIRICETELKSKNPKIYKSFSVETPENIINDGILTVTGELIDLLKSSLKENHIMTKQVIFSVSSTKIASREILIPEIKENRIRDMLETNASDYFPVDISKYSLSYSILDSVTAESVAKKLKLLVLATPKQIMESYRELASGCGLKLVAVDYSGNSIFQAIRQQCTSGVEMVVKVDEKATFLMILKEGKLLMQRTVAYGIDETIALVSEMNGNLSYKETIELLRTEDQIVTEPSEVLSGEDGIRKRRVTESLEYLIKGINRVLDYHNSRNPAEAVQQIGVTGIGGELKNFDILLANELGIHTKVLKGMEGSNVAKAFADSNSYFGEFIACVGAAIDPIWPVAEEKKNTGKDKTKNTDMDKLSGLVLLIGALAAIAIIVYSLVSQAVAVQKGDDLTAEIERLKPAEAVYIKYNYMKTLEGDALTIQGLTKNSNNYLKEFIEEMEEKMPSDISITSLTGDNTSITMNITVETKESAAAILEELRLFDSVSTLETTGLTEVVNEGGISEVSFTVSCIYKTQEERESQ
jgi:type IV pilus assembly protein PilN